MHSRIISVAIVLLAAIVGIGLMTAAADGTYGGTLSCALASEPGTLDMQMTTGVAASIPARHMLEGLFAFDENYAPQPMLAESWELDDSGTVVTFNLRMGVLFHDGTEMKADDVLASLNRWGAHGSTAAALWSHVEDLTAVDDYTIQMTLDEPFAPMTTFLANIYGGPSIYPAEIVSAAGEEPIAPEDCIGTGPYKFSEWKSGNYILLERWGGYSASDMSASGFAGEKTAYFDKLQFFMVPEDNARIVGLEAGTYDYVVNIPNDLLANVEGNPDVTPLITDHPPIYPIMLINNENSRVSGNSVLKQAILAALDMEPIMLAGYGDPMFWGLNGSYFAPGIRWKSDVGIEDYNQGDPDRARELAKQAGYNGEVIRLIVAQDMTSQYNQALVVNDQLQQAGFATDLQVYDKPTFFARRNNREDPEWEFAFSYYSTTPDPSLVLMLNPDYAGWWNSPEIQKLRGELNKIVDFDERFAKWEEIRELWYVQVPAIKFGDAYQLHLMRADVGGGYGTVERPVMLSPYFWNSWK